MAIHPFVLGCGVVVAIAGATAATTYAFSLSGNQCTPGQVAGGNIGGPFELVAGSGETVTERDMITGPTLVYFGYTFCPDVCPVDVGRNAIAMDILTEEGVEVAGLFITVDPGRDTVDVVRDFAANFHENMTGLTGSTEQVDGAKQSYRVLGQVPEDTSDPYYLVSHSSFTYLMEPEAGLLDFYRTQASAEEVALSVGCSLTALEEERAAQEDT